jgi:hypothetical protein
MVARIATVLAVFGLVVGTWVSEVAAISLGGGIWSAFGNGASVLGFGDPDQQSPRFNCTLSVRKYLSSFTSYEFPNPFAPFQDPLSRLEFPIDQWFLGGDVRYTSRWWAIAIDGAVNLSRESQLMMQDSDWEDDARPDQKTVFSESKCRLNRGMLVDVKLSLPSPIDLWLDVRPVIGYRHQYFSFTTYDGFQGDIRGNRIALPGDGIEFEQAFYHIYVGVDCFLEINGSRLMSALPRGQLEVQADYAAVVATNEDLHLLRLGERVTREKSSGHCWHLGLKAFCWRMSDFRLGFEGDFKRVITTGSHNLTNGPLRIDFSFGGSKIWSDQAWIGVIAQTKF